MSQATKAAEFTEISLTVATSVIAQSIESMSILDQD